MCRSEILCEILSYSNVLNAALYTNKLYTLQGIFRQTLVEEKCHNFSVHNCVISDIPISRHRYLCQFHIQQWHREGTHNVGKLNCYPSRGTCKHLFIIETEINLKNKDKRIKLKTMGSSNLSICFRTGSSGEVEKFQDLFQEGVNCTEECDICSGKEKKA